MTCAPRITSSPTSPGPRTFRSAVLDPGLGAGDRDPDRGRTRVELVGRQVRRALALRQPVHRVEARVRERAADRGDGRRGERGARVRQEAQVGQLAIGEATQRDEHVEDRRDARQAGDPGLLEQLHHAPREREARLEHQRRSHAHRHQELVEAVVERQRQRAEDPVRLVHAQVLDDRVRGERHVAVGERDPLRVAGRAGGVDDGREVDADRRPVGCAVVEDQLADLGDDRDRGRRERPPPRRPRPARASQSTAAAPESASTCASFSCLIVGFSGEKAAPARRMP